MFKMISIFLLSLFIVIAILLGIMFYMGYDIVSRADIRGVRPKDPYVLMSLVNQHRADIGLQPLERKNELCNISDQRADDIKVNCSHQLLHIKYKVPYTIAENLSCFYDNEREALEGWLKSTPHKKTLEGDWKYTCITCLEKNCVQIFSSFDKSNHKAL